MASRSKVLVSVALLVLGAPRIGRAQSDASPAPTVHNAGDGEKLLAEPAPSGYTPSWQLAGASPSPLPIGVQPKDPLPRWRLSAAAILAVNLGRLPSPLGKLGYGAEVGLTGGFFALGGARLGVAFDFTYARIETHQSPMPGGTLLGASGQAIFGAGLILDGRIGRVRPFFSLEAGLDITQRTIESQSLEGALAFKTPVDVLGVLRFAGGFSVLLARNIDLGLRADIDAVFGGPEAGAPSRGVFSPGLLTLGLELGFRI